MSTPQRQEDLTRLLADGGWQAGLPYVARAARCRFAGIFRFDGGRLQTLAQCDLEQTHPGAQQPVPACAAPVDWYLRDSSGALALIEGGQGSVLECCSVPIMDAEGALLATLSCWGPQAPEAPGFDVELMLQAASALARGWKLPPQAQTRPRPRGRAA